jgi:small subunit ribosomal protein S25e
MGMGGKKKLTMKQAERMQSRKDEEDKEKKKEKAGGPSREKKPLGIVSPDTRSEKIFGEIKKMNVLTPYAVASRFNIRISAAKSFLEQLEESGKVQLVSGSHNIKIYKPVG